MRHRLVLAIALILLASACSGSSPVTVVYEATGSVDQAMVEYRTPDDEANETVDLPWEHSFEVDGSFDVGLTVTNLADAGTVGCSLDMVGAFRPIDAEGEVSATCNGTGSFSGSTASGSFETSFLNREADPAGPTAADPYLLVNGQEAAAAGPFDTVELAVPLLQLTDEIVLSIVVEGAGRRYSEDVLLEAGDHDDWPTPTYYVPVGISNDTPAGDHELTVAIEVADATGTFPEPAEAFHSLTLTVDPDQIGTTVFAGAGGRFELEYPNSWERDFARTLPSPYITNAAPGPPGYQGANENMWQLAEFFPRDRAGVVISVFVEGSAFTAPPFPEWVDLQVQDFESQGGVVTSREDVTLDHGPGIMMTGTAELGTFVRTFTAVGPRLYMIQVGANPDVAQQDIDEAVDIASGIRFDPAVEPTIDSGEELRTLTLTLSQDNTPTLEIDLYAPAPWEHGEFVELNPDRWVFGFEPVDAADFAQFVVIAELLGDDESTLDLDDYADFYLPSGDEGFEEVSRGPTEIDGRPGLSVVWKIGGRVIRDHFTTAGDWALRIQHEADEPADDPDLVALLLDLLTITTL